MGIVLPYNIKIYPMDSDKKIFKFFYILYIKQLEI